MYEIIDKKILNPTVIQMDILAPLVAAKAKPGQFIILRTDENGERIPLTIADYDTAKGTVTIIFQIVGATTETLGHLNTGDCLHDFVGPLGRESELEGLSRAVVVAGGVGCAIAYPVIKALHRMGCETITIVGFRSRDLVILEEEMKAASDTYVMTTDDGSYGQKGRVTDPLVAMLEQGKTVERVITIGPLIMMKAVSAVTKGFGVSTVASMNPIMIDGTGMCGGCRLMVGGETKFACVDGPEFDAHLIDFDDAMSRNTAYREKERERHEAPCRLFGGKGHE